MPLSRNSHNFDLQNLYLHHLIYEVNVTLQYVCLVSLIEQKNTYFLW